MKKKNINTVRVLTEIKDNNYLFCSDEQGLAKIASKNYNKHCGGMNLIQDTRNFGTRFGKGGVCTTSVEKLKNPLGEIDSILKITLKNYNEIGYFRFTDLPLIEGEKYTFSCWITRFQHSQGLFGFNGADTYSAPKHYVMTEVDKWVYTHFTFTSKLNLKIINIVHSIPGTADFWLWHPMLVHGEIPANWMPAVEDLVFK